MITLYSTGCPKCKVLFKKLEQKNINFQVCNDFNIMTEKQIVALPVLEIDGKLLGFKSAVDWINKKEG